MELRIVSTGNAAVVEGLPATPLLRSAEDVAELLGVCFEHQARGVLLYADNLPSRFFDLSSGEAGAILQKLRTYHVKLAVVESPAGHSLSAKFRDMLAEEQRGGDFGLFADRAAAEAWLSST